MPPPTYCDVAEHPVTIGYSDQLVQSFNQELQRYDLPPSAPIPADGLDVLEGSWLYSGYPTTLGLGVFVLRGPPDPRCWATINFSPSDDSLWGVVACGGLWRERDWEPGFYATSQCSVAAGDVVGAWPISLTTLADDGSVVGAAEALVNVHNVLPHPRLSVLVDPFLVGEDPNVDIPGFPWLDRPIQMNVWGTGGEPTGLIAAGEVPHGWVLEGEGSTCCTATFEPILADVGTWSVPMLALDDDGSRVPFTIDFSVVEPPAPGCGGRGALVLVAPILAMRRRRR